MPIFRLKCRGVIVGHYIDRDNLNDVMDKILNDDPEAKSSMHVTVIWW